jgi:cytochrome c biogenesis protein ResB
MKVNLASTRFAFFLLATLTLFIVISAIVPQRDIAQNQIVDWQHLLGDGYVVIEKLQMDRIFTSPMFLITVVLMCINLIAGNAQRVGRLRKVRSARGRTRILGSILFHFAIIIIIAGTSLNHLYKSRVVFGITEGQRIADRPEAYFRDFSGPFARTTSDRFVIGLEEVDTAFRVGEVETKAAYISVAGTGGREPAADYIRVNHPLRLDGVEFHLGSQIGFSPELSVSDGDGQQEFRSFVRLARQRTEDGAMDADMVFLGNDSTRVELKIVAGTEPGEPQTMVLVESGGEELYSGVPGAAGVTLADGRTISVPRLRRWCYVEAIRNPFISMVFTGFWIALGSLVFTLVPRMLPARRSAS